MEADLLIIGAGPAGLNAALTADKAGAKVILIDESFSLGGQLLQQTQWFSGLPNKYGKLRGTSVNNKLINQLKCSNVKVLNEHLMIGSYGNGTIGVSDGDKTFEICALKNILAPGAAEEAKIFPGWTLPGVMTAGAAQKLINREHVIPGTNAIIVGSNDYSFEVAKQLESCGVIVEAIVECKNQIVSNNSELVESLGDVPIFVGSTVELASGNGEVEYVEIQTPDGLKAIRADLICISNGFSPIIEPFEIMNCNLVYQKELGGWIPEYDINFQTSNPTCYIAGNAAGITGLGSILLTGKIAAIGALSAIGYFSKEVEIERNRKYWTELKENENKKVLEARTRVIANFHHKSRLDLPNYFNEI